ncbi:MAG: SusC/RagA family TonB-linked outer membrane protein [Proteiniphilum sp.]|jgi:TonB-linked SusC/RagA family outer membrane protein|nr:SusC/RagA family TonB-linked outer membrane protein [Proteiniphilum sp.]
MKNECIIPVISVLIAVFLFPSSPAEAQNRQEERISMTFNNELLTDVFKRMEPLSGYKILFTYDDIRDIRVSGSFRDKPVEEALKGIIGNKPLKYRITEKYINITLDRQRNRASTGDPDNPVVTGFVYDTEGEPLIGVSVTLTSNRSAGTVTDIEGKFTLKVDSPEEMLVFSYVGMKKKELPARNIRRNAKIVLENDTELSEVVVEAGVIQRSKLGFTGSYKQVDREELLSVGNINILQTLGVLDPAFTITENNLAGSNPNAMANISLRGGSTINITNVLDDQTSNPNEPLFILDGFETTLETVNDLDINRIESITILKDASSTAIYGSKGGNGVVVIETIKPKMGELMINYGGDLKIAAADLSEYNLMNAAEKLEFELKSGRYGNITDWSGNADKIADYMSRLGQVNRGVNTYWLKVPVRTALTQSHSLNLSGGNEGFLYQAGVNYRDVMGVMKGSERQTFGGNMRLTYRRGNLSVSNNLIVSVTDGRDGSWGSFSDFVNANPYYIMRNADGTISEYLDSYRISENYRPTNAYNPLYNAMLASRRDTKTQSLTNNLSFDWRITERLRWQASVSLGTTSTDAVSFRDPKHTSYIGMDYTRKGEYTSTIGKNWRYNLNTTVNYAISLQNAHNLTFTGRASAQSDQSNRQAYSLTGFPPGVEGIPSYAYSYREGSVPDYAEEINRQVSFLAAFNYNYRYRYLFDVNYNADGTTAFGRNQKFRTFYSVGAGWNLHREAFAREWKALQELRLRGSYGINGNQNVSNYSVNVYRYYSGSDIFGTASYMSGYANPNLKWQVVKKASTGIDAVLLNNRLSLNVDVYSTNTDPMVVDVDQKPSSGVSKYPVNMGYIKTQGVEFAAGYYIIRNIPRQISLNVRLTGNTYHSEYGGFGSALENLNNAFRSDGSVKATLNPNSLIRYQDGSSPTALWAVRSLGIDPASGKEVFLTKDGLPTSTYSIDDRVKIADSKPDIRGIVGIGFRYRKFIANLNFGYSLGGYRFNSALFNKVENISTSNIVYNQDRRALYDRWQKPGDETQFKGISNIGSVETQMSSRFIQRDNYFNAESGKITWDFSKDRWLKATGMEDFRVSISMSDLFRMSTIRQERGIDYPFERSVTMGVSARF